MRALLRQLMFLLASLGFWHGVVWAVSMAVVPPKPGFDSLPASETIYLTDAKLVAAAVAGMGATGAPKMIFFGPSNVTSAFRPAEVHRLFPLLEVHQLGLGFHNVSHSRLEARLLTQTVPRAVLEKSVFVLGVWYGGFVENGHPSLFDMESVFLRSGLFVRTGGAIEPVAGPALMPGLLQLCRPFHFAQYLVDSRLGTYKPHQADRFVNAPAKGNEKEQSLEVIEDKWLRHPDRTLANQQFDELLEVAKVISGAGSTLVIVDMALPRWHTAHASYLPSYEQQKAKYWPQLAKIPRVELIDLTHAETILDDDKFYDLNHVTMDATHLWAEALRERWTLSGP